MWKIIQTCGWREIDGAPLFPDEENVVVFSSKHWLVAAWWKFWHYDFGADPAWKSTFIWKIHHITSVEIS